MRLALVSSPPVFSRLFSFTLKQGFNYLANADAHYRDRRRLEDMPPERLRDMGLTGPGPRPWSPPHQAGYFFGGS